MTSVVAQEKDCVGLKSGNEHGRPCDEGHPGLRRGHASGIIAGLVSEPCPMSSSSSIYLFELVPLTTCIRKRYMKVERYHLSASHWSTRENSNYEKGLPRALHVLVTVTVCHPFISKMRHRRGKNLSIFFQLLFSVSCNPTKILASEIIREKHAFNLFQKTNNKVCPLVSHEAARWTNWSARQPHSAKVVGLIPSPAFLCGVCVSSPLIGPSKLSQSVTVSENGCLQPVGSVLCLLPKDRWDRPQHTRATLVRMSGSNNG